MVLNFARNVGNAPKEGLKMITQWVVYYFTNPKSWYPAPKVPWSCRLHWYSNVITCTDSTTEHTEDEGLGKQIWCSSASDGKSWNSPVKLWSERDSATCTAQLWTLWLQVAAKKGKNRQRGKWDIRVWFPSRDEETDGSFPDNKTGCDDGGIPSLEQEAPFIMEDFPTSEEVFASQQNYIQSIFLYFPCCGTNGIAVRFCCFTDTLVDIVICFFDTDLSLLKNMFFHDHS